jgi:lipoprotein-releasing system permease protein
LRKSCPEIVAASPFVQIKAVLRRGGSPSRDYEAGLVIGVDAAREGLVTHLAENLTNEGGRTFGAGHMPGKGEIVLGYILAQNLGVYLGDDVGVITPGAMPSPLGRVSTQIKSLTVSGISQAQMTDYDSVYAYVDLETAQQIKRQHGVDGIHCMLADPLTADVVAGRIQDELGFTATTWYESNRFFFEALKQEKVAMFIILMFIVLVAAFNIMSTLIMVVMEKKRDIGILRTLGVGAGTVIRLFMLEGLYIGLSGTVCGLLLGIILAHNLNPVAGAVAWVLGVDVFNSVIYHFDHIPVAVVPRDVALITVAAFALTFVSTLYPAWSASRLDPVDALRYE